MEAKNKSYIIEGRRYSAEGCNEYKEYSKNSDFIYADKRARSIFLKHRGNIETRVIEVDVNNTKRRCLIKSYQREDDG